MIPTPFNEKYRLAALQSYQGLDTEPEPDFDRLTRLAARHFRVPIALVSLVDETRQWFKSRVGLDATETAREISFCGHAIMRDEVLQVPDARCDARFADNPLVTGDPEIRFYAGAPLIAPTGYRIGTLCVIDFRPRDPLSDDDLAMLTDLAAVVVDQLELRRRLRALESDAAATPCSRDRARSGDAQLDAIAGMAHDLRTPLNAIIGLNQIIEDQMFGPIDPQYLELAKGARKSSRYLLDLVNDTLEFAHLRSGEVPLKEQDIDLGGIVWDCVSMLTEQAKAADLALDLAMPSRPPLLRADPHRVMQMLINLIGNGIKYTPAGGAVRVAVEGRLDGGLTLSVADTGVGIPEDARARALAPFGRVDNTATAEREGSGLGLPLTQRMIEMHSGFLSLDAAEGGGTVAALHFPPHRVVGAG